MFNHLFKPLSLGSTTISNRICLLPHRTHFSERGDLDDRQVAYYKRRAKGGCGMITLGGISIDANDQPWAKQIRGYETTIVGDYKNLSGAVHEHDCRLYGQLCHHGFQSGSAITRNVTLGPSATADIAFGETCKAMEPEDFEKVIDSFVKAALYAKQGLFDGVVIDMGPYSLLRQFLSLVSNARQDAYGGDLENRARFPLMVVKAVRSALGAVSSIGVELSADEMFYGGLNTDDSGEIIKLLQDSGAVDFIVASVGTYYNLQMVQPTMYIPADFNLETIAAVKNASDLPVIAGHHAGRPESFENSISEGFADAVGITRALICDPDLPQKARAGKQDEIRTCARDNKGCVGRINQSKSLGCVQNPEVGTEGREQKKSYPKADHPKKVMVIGAGPAGMEVTRVAFLRGHEVTLYDKSIHLGGQINIASKGAGRQPMAEISNNLSKALQRLNVPVQLGFDITAEFVMEKDPDVVIVATGSKPIKKPVSGEYGPPFVLNTWDVLLQKYPVGQKVLVVENNTGRDTTATAQLLADQDKEVTFVTSELFVGTDSAAVGDLYTVRQQLLKKGVTFLTDIQIDSIKKRTAVGRKLYTNAPLTFTQFDTIVLDMGYQVEDALYINLKGQVKGLFRIGDCVAPRGIEMAFFEGRKLGETL